MLLQALLGGIAGLVVAMKVFGRRVLSFLRLRPREGSDTPTADTKEPH
jgi:hypothetical protein